MNSAQQIYSSFGGLQTVAYGWSRNTSLSFTKKGPGVATSKVSVCLTKAQSASPRSKRVCLCRF